MLNHINTISSFCKDNLRDWARATPMHPSLATGCLTFSQKREEDGTECPGVQAITAHRNIVLATALCTINWSWPGAGRTP